MVDKKSGNMSNLTRQVDDIIQEFNDKNQSYENLDNSETDAAFQKLIGSIGESYERDRFSMKFKDITLEQEYLESYHQKIKSYGIIYTIEAVVIWANYFIFQTARLILLNNKYPLYKWAVVTTVAFSFQVIVHYFLARRWKFFAINFTSFQSLILYMAIVEASILGNPTQAQVDGFIIIPGALVSAAYASYDQRTVLFSYFSIMLYSLVRTYSWINDNFRYARFNMFVFIALGIVYSFARFSQNRDRERFEQSKNQKQLLRLFHNLIRVYHDGIIITQNQEIVYNNKSVNNVFEIQGGKNQTQSGTEREQQQDQEQQQQENCMKTNFDENGGNAENIQLNENSQSMNSLFQEKRQQFNEQIDQRTYVKALKRAKPKRQQTFNNSTISFSESDDKNFTDLWDYIQKNQQYLDPVRFNRDYLINPLDGIYFKVKPKKNKQYPQNTNDQLQETESPQKILQVFTQTLRLGNKVFVMTTVRDQSNWLEIEKQKNLSQLKTIAFASAAHEFRNPLNAINSSLHLLEEYVVKSLGKQYLSTAMNSSRLMLFLVNDILDFSQLESKQLVLNCESISIQQLADQCFSILQLKAHVKSLDFSFEFSQDFPAYFHTDPNRLSQILINLLSNALKYTEQGYVKLKGLVDTNRNLLLLQIKDSGVGISQNQLNNLFVAFTKIMNNRHLNKEGVGLGLTISKNLAKALGGDITVTSQANSGSIFTVALPYQNSNNQSLDSEVDLQEVTMSFIETLGNNQKLVQNTFGKFKALDALNQHQSQMTKEPFNIANTQNNKSTIDYYSIDINKTNNVFESQQLMTNNQRKKRHLSNQNIHMVYKAKDSVSFSILSNSDSDKIHKTSMYCQCPRVLVADDDPFNLLAIKGLLSQLKIDKVEQCYNGQQALEKVLKNQEMTCMNHRPYDLIIIDNQMPVMNGIEATQRMKQIEEENKDKIKLGRIVLLTGDEHLMTNEEYSQLFDDIILKPIDSNILGVLLMQTANFSES
eukprot:403369061